MPSAEHEELLGDPEALLANCTALVDRYAAESGVWEVCSVVWLSPRSARGLDRWIRPTRWPRHRSAQQILDAGVRRSDTDPIGGLTTVGEWTVVVDPWFNWPTLLESGAVDDRAVVLTVRPSNPTTVRCIRSGATTFCVDVRTGVVDPWGTDLAALEAALDGLPRGPVDDHRALALAVTARLVGVVPDDALFTGPYRGVSLGSDEVDETDLLRDFHGHPAAADPALLAIVADTASGPASLRALATQCAEMAVRLGGVGGQPLVAAGLAALRSGDHPGGDRAWQERLLAHVEPESAVLRGHRNGDDDESDRTPDEWVTLFTRTGAVTSLAAAFDPDPYAAASRAWVDCPSVDQVVPGATTDQDDYVRQQILVRCLHRARDSGRWIRM